MKTTRILIVDDNIMNCKMAMRLLEPLQVEAETAENGQIALEKIQANSYDLVLMDHMMPVMDGVEAVKQLRTLDGGKYQKLPVIALTAATEPETEQLLSEAGMNDFVAKPIQAEVFYEVLAKWLQDADYGTMCKRQTSPEEVQESGAESTIEIEGIDVKEGIKNSGGYDFLISLLGIFHQLIDTKAQMIVKFIADGLIRDYTVEVHALKSTARMIGALELSAQFEHLESLGNACEIEQIRQETPAVLEHYLRYKIWLEPYAAVTKNEAVEVPKEKLLMYLQGMQEAAEVFDLDCADKAFEELSKCRIPVACESLLEQLRVYLADVDMDHVIETAQEMIKVLEIEEE